MIDLFTQLKTSDTLLAALRHSRQMTNEELLEQRVSFVYGSLDSDTNTLTREKVRQAIIDQEGVGRTSK